MELKVSEISTDDQSEIYKKFQLSFLLNGSENVNIIAIDKDADRSLYIDQFSNVNAETNLTEILERIEIWSKEEGYFCLYGSATNEDNMLRTAFTKNGFDIKDLDKAEGENYFQLKDYKIRYMKMIASPENLP